MDKALILKNIEQDERFERDAFYRLDCVTGLDLLYTDEPRQRFTSLSVNFKKYTSEFQTLEAIKKINHLDRFKKIVDSRKVVEDKSISIAVDITNLYILKPGSIWKGGRFIWEPSNSVDINLTQKNFDQYQIELVRYSQELNSNGKSILPYFKNSDYTYYLKIPDTIINGRHVVTYIPVMEVIRFYYSGSPYFIEQIFNGGFEPRRPSEQLVYKYNFDKETQLVYLWLRRHCRDSDAIIIARSIANEQAMKSSNLIFSSLLTEYTNKQDQREIFSIEYLCPKTELPFSSSTTLGAQAQWLQPDEDGVFNSLLIRRITSCTCKLPFKTLQIESVDSYKSSNNIVDVPQPILETEVMQTGDELKLTHNQRPSSKINTQEYQFYEEIYNNLSEVEIEKVKKTSEKDLEHYIKFEIELSNSDEGSTKTGDYEQHNKLAPWELVRTHEKPIPIDDRISEVSEAIFEICKSEKYKEVALPIGKTDISDPYGLYTFSRPPGKNSKYNWNIIGDRQRKALFIEIENNNNYIYLLEIEATKSRSFRLFFLAHQNHAKTKSNHVAFLQQIAIDSARNIEKIAQNYNFKKFNLRHGSTENDPLLDRIRRQLKELFSLKSLE